jgi:hypothetical protein
VRKAFHPVLSFSQEQETRLLHFLPGRAKCFLCLKIYTIALDEAEYVTLGPGFDTCHFSSTHISAPKSLKVVANTSILLSGG